MPSWIAGRVEVRNVTFSFKPFKSNSVGELPILRNLSFKLPSGRCVSIVGYNRSGKTMLSNLLLKLFEPDSGSISVESENLLRWELDVYRRGLGFVEQDAVMLGDTVEECIKYGNPTATSEKVQKVAEVVELNSWISSLRNGIQTRCETVVTQK